MKTPLTAMAVAEYFLTLQEEEAGDLISHMKLQELLYYAQGLHLALNGRPLFDDTIEAWTHGPVVPTVYREFKRFGEIPSLFKRAMDTLFEMRGRLISLTRSTTYLANILPGNYGI
jgi:uncharacterized phage-associated protein